MVRTLLKVLVRRHGGLLSCAGLAVATLSGCIIPTPIEEEIPEENFPPFINQQGEDAQVSPSLGVVDIELSPLLPITTFSVLSVEDPNEDQTLFFRAVVDYGNIAIANGPEPIPPEDREGRVLSFDYSPCQGNQLFGIQGRTGDDAVLAIGVSDSPFIPDLVGTRVFQADEFGQARISAALENVAGTPVAIAMWGLRFEGDCGQ